MEASINNNTVQAAQETTQATVKNVNPKLEAVKLAHKALVDAVLAKVMAQAIKAFGACSQDSAFSIAKDMGLIASQKGKSGGTKATGMVKTNDGEVEAKGAAFLGGEAQNLMLAIAKAEGDYKDSLEHGPESATEIARKLGVEVKGKKVKVNDLLQLLMKKMSETQAATQPAVQAQTVEAQAKAKAPVARKH